MQSSSSLSVTYNIKIIFSHKHTNNKHWYEDEPCVYKYLNHFLLFYVFVLLITYLFMFVNRHECIHFTYILLNDKKFFLHIIYNSALNIKFILYITNALFI